jgi:hypothetical protein
MGLVKLAWTNIGFFTQYSIIPPFHYSINLMRNKEIETS